ncbi:hypothetical protein QBC47DRAFT_326192 [Echria macrotheca]|uniref:Uncharacterized protein n=1 Tax=Echria macrotheca TaxID=438768 RepID=A0AAJ0B902_9PEZI|nr:hypothetical protein QBC47DRAFT_326192 [Echria macrotheca]
MPPKRAAPSSAAASKPPAKKSRPSTEGTGTENAAAPEPTRDPRWAPLSGSANADMNYKITMSNPVEAYSFTLLCQPPFPNSDEDDEDDEEDEEDEEEEDEAPKKQRCDGGKTCICSKPASEYPDHPWKLSVAGKTKYFIQHTQCDLRDPDNFGMYTFNDHMAYGVLEVIQNLFLDYQNASDNVKEQWAVCEALGLLLACGRGMEMSMIDDGELFEKTLLLVGHLFLSMLARLERENLLSKDSEILNLGTIMAIYMMIAAQTDGGFQANPPKESIGPKKDGKNWRPTEFPSHILAYARKYDIELVGPHNIEELVSEAKEDADLPVPESNTGAKADPFGFEKALKAYSLRYRGVTQFLSKRKKAGKTPIGGDALDITSWTSAERKASAYDGKDPFGAKEIAALKKGDVLGMR